MRYVLGVDGGQTSTLAVVATEDGELLAAGRGGPANHLDEPGGPERLRRSLDDAIGHALDAAGLRGQRIAAACFGMTGSGALVPTIIPSIVAVDKLRVENDAVTALAGATVCRPGVVVISGTGSVAFGADERGERVAVGGWGYIVRLHAVHRPSAGQGPGLRAHPRPRRVRPRAGRRRGALPPARAGRRGVRGGRLLRGRRYGDHGAGLDRPAVPPRDAVWP